VLQTRLRTLHITSGLSDALSIPEHGDAKLKSNRNDISQSQPQRRHGTHTKLQRQENRPTGKPVVQEDSDQRRITLNFSVSSHAATKVWNHLVDEMEKFERRYRVVLLDLDIRSIPCGLEN